MADRPDPVIRVAGTASAGLVAAITLGALAAVALRADGPPSLSPSDWAAIRFTLIQATLSALISTGLAIPVARALARRRFAGRDAIVTLLGAPFLLPVIVAMLGLLAVFGRGGLISQALAPTGLGPIHIYGLHGVVLAHVFFNLPLATRLILQGWTAIPAERFRLAASLGFSPTDTYHRLETPMLRETLPGAFLLIFLICTTSFAVVLALGGGPGGTTVELAIYQAFRFEFDLFKAALLALIQVAICATAALLVWRATVPAGFGAGHDRPVERWGIGHPGLRVLDAAVITLAALFLLTPMAMVAARGLPGLPQISADILLAALRSFAVAFAAAAISVTLALSMALLATTERRLLAAPVALLAQLSIAISPLVIGTGLFIMLYPVADPMALALPLTAIVNAVMSLPFVYRILQNAASDTLAVSGRLSASLGLSGWARLRVVLLPRLVRPLGFAAGLSAALSMGDLGVIVLFAAPDAPTLPMQMYRLMAAYQMDQAAAAALVLLVGTLALFWVFDAWGRARAAT